MDTTPQSPELDGRRRRLLFRANHRGTRETDILIGGFVSRHIQSFSDPELDALESLLDVPDPIIMDWLMGLAPVPPTHDSTLVAAMRARA
jgi:antitoxin CptB